MTQRKTAETPKPAAAEKATANKAEVTTPPDAEKASEETDTATVDVAEVAATVAADTPADAEAETTTTKVDGNVPSTDAGEKKTVIMAISITGYRDGQPWPGPGEPVTLPKDEADSFIRLGYATTEK